MSKEEIIYTDIAEQLFYWMDQTQIYHCTSNNKKDTCTVVLPKDAGTIQYHTGSGLRVNTQPVTPDTWEVWQCLVSEAIAIDQSFTDWCDDLGFDENTFSAFGTYKACCETGKKLRKLRLNIGLANDYFIAVENEEIKKNGEPAYA